MILWFWFTMYTTDLAFLIPWFDVLWQESHENDDHCVSSWFRSHPAGSYPWGGGREQTMDPYQARPFLSPHILLNDIIHQAHPLASPMVAHSFNKTSHITPQGHIIIKSFSRSLLWDLCWSPQETDQRSWVQD